MRNRSERPIGVTAVFEHLLAPLIIGFFVLLGQFFLQPIIQERVASTTDLWTQKREVYVDASALVDKKFDSLNFPNAPAIGPAPTDPEINEIYRKLLLVADDVEIIVMFGEFMTFREDNYHSAGNRARFLFLMRSDLNKSSTALMPDTIPYFREQF